VTWSAGQRVKRAQLRLQTESGGQGGMKSDDFRRGVLVFFLVVWKGGGKGGTATRKKNWRTPGQSGPKMERERLYTEEDEVKTEDVKRRAIT